MKIIFIIPMVLMSLMSSPCWGESMEDLVLRAGLYYKKFTATPFTGEVDGLVVGSLTEGVRNGIWFYYHENGQLASKGEYNKEGRQGNWVSYFNNGSLAAKGEWLNNKKEGYHIQYFHPDQPPFRDWTGYFKNDVKVRD